MRQLQQYTYTIPANGSVMIPAANDNFIIQASTGPLTVRGDTFGSLRGLVAGQGLKLVEFKRLELVDESGAPNTVTLLMTPAEFVNQTFSGSVSIVGGNLTDAQLRAAPVPVRVDQEPGANWASTAQLVANTPLTVFLAGANVNGAIIHAMEAFDAGSGANAQVFIAKATAPASVTDGVIVAQAIITAATAAPIVNMGISRHVPVRLPAGLGLYFIAASGGSVGVLRSCRYTLL